MWLGCLESVFAAVCSSSRQAKASDLSRDTLYDYYHEAGRDYQEAHDEAPENDCQVFSHSLLSTSTLV